MAVGEWSETGRALACPIFERSCQPRYHLPAAVASMVHLWTATVLAAALLLPAVDAQSAGPESGGPLMTDAPGDVAAKLADQAAPAPAGAWDAVDLVSLALTEAPDSFAFDLGVVDLGPDGPRQDWGSFEVDFLFGGTAFQVYLYRSIDNAAFYGRLLVDGHYLHDLPALRDLATGHVGTTLDRRELVASDGRLPGKGDLIEAIHVRSTANIAQTVSASDSPATWVGDVMPDAGLVSWTVLHGGSQGVGARLASTQPFRVSNGEATTYEIPVQATFDGTETARFRLTAEGVPMGWQVQLPGDLVDLPIGRPVSFGVLLTVSFAHIHGSTQAFVLRLAEEGGESWATIELGIHYTTVPQPSGHHPDLWLHSIQWSAAARLVNPAVGSATGELFMNTLEGDAGDYGVPIVGEADIGSDDAVYHWHACLVPSLAIGLDFDLQATGILRLPMQSTRPLAGSVIEGRLLRLGPGAPLHDCFTASYADRPSRVVAKVASGPTDLAPGVASVLEAAITPTPDGDYVPFEDGAAFVLEFMLKAQGPGIGGIAGVSLLPGGTMTLPLDEYHDALAALSYGNATEAPPGFVASSGPAKGSPGLSPGLALGPLALLALALRRRR